MKEKKEKNDEWNDSTLKFFFLKAISSFFLFFLISYIECGKQLNVEKINKQKGIVFDANVGQMLEERSELFLNEIMCRNE